MRRPTSSWPRASSDAGRVDDGVPPIGAEVGVAAEESGEEGAEEDRRGRKRTAASPRDGGDRSTTQGHGTVGGETCQTRSASRGSRRGPCARATAGLGVPERLKIQTRGATVPAGEASAALAGGDRASATGAGACAVAVAVGGEAGVAAAVFADFGLKKARSDFCAIEQSGPETNPDVCGGRARGDFAGGGSRGDDGHRSKWVCAGCEGSMQAEGGEGGAGRGDEASYEGLGRRGLRRGGGRLPAGGTRNVANCTPHAQRGRGTTTLQHWLCASSPRLRPLLCLVRSCTSPGLSSCRPVPRGASDESRAHPASTRPHGFGAFAPLGTGSGRCCGALRRFPAVAIETPAPHFAWLPRSTCPAP